MNKQPVFRAITYGIHDLTPWIALVYIMFVTHIKIFTPKY